MWHLNRPTDNIDTLEKSNTQTMKTR